MKRGLPQTVRCPECWQPAGHPCLTGARRRAHYAHVSRKREASRTATTSDEPTDSLPDPKGQEPA